jgi:hypothetical protein
MDALGSGEFVNGMDRLGRQSPYSRRLHTSQVSVTSLKHHPTLSQRAIPCSVARRGVTCVCERPVPLGWNVDITEVLCGLHLLWGARADFG